MKSIEISDKVKEGAPGLKVLQIEARLNNPATSDELWAELEEAGKMIRDGYEISHINKREAIAATRRAYKTFGKDPNRYRPSAEALCRRMVNGKGLYRTSTLIDLINLVSMRSGCSIGGFDADRISGDTLTLDVGEKNEPFEAIGRGMLNIEGLPLYRDMEGGIGTPTSDCERTKLTSETTHLLMLVNIYGEEMTVAKTEAYARTLLERYAGAEDIEARLIEATK